MAFLSIALFVPTGTLTASKYLWLVVRSVKNFRRDTNGASSLTIVWHAVGSDVASRNSTLLSFEQLSVIIALFAVFALKPAAPAQGGMS